jgi:hypothetical protein
MFVLVNVFCKISNRLVSKSLSEEKAHRSDSNDEQPVYFANSDRVPSSERRLVRVFFIEWGPYLTFVRLVHHRHPHNICSLPKLAKNSTPAGSRVVCIVQFTLTAIY